MTRESAQRLQNINRYRITWLTQRQKYLIRKYVIQNLFILASVLTYVIRPFLPNSWTRVDRPIFIVGCSRSGTTLFLDIFARHPDIANWSEAAQLFELRYCDPEIDHEKTEIHATPFTRARLRTIIGMFVRITGKKRFLNKHPENSVRIRLLKRIFPDALFIHMIRDGRAVLLSNYAQTQRERHRTWFAFGWFPKPPAWRQYRDLPWLEQFAHQWVDLVEYIRDCVPDAVPEHDYIEIRYEDFCASPQETLRVLDEFCGLDNDLRKVARLEELETRNRRWRTDLPPEDLARIMPVVLPLLTQLGYEDAKPTMIESIHPGGSRRASDGAEERPARPIPDVIASGR